LQSVSNDQNSYQRSPSGECGIAVIKTALLVGFLTSEEQGILIPENEKSVLYSLFTAQLQ